MKFFVKYHIEILFSIFLLGIVACSGLIEDEPQTDPREYTWTVDTLSYPNEFQTYLSNVWGSSGNDVYAVGHCTVVQGTMWYFNGYIWEPVVLAQVDGGNIVGHHSIQDVFGFGEDDVWAIGYKSHSFDNDEGLVIHYDGREWNEVIKLPTEQLSTIWGTSSNDLWVGGIFGGLHHYNGATWLQYTIPVSEAYDTTNYSMFDVITGNDSNNIYAKYRISNQLTILLHYNGSEWTEMDRFSFYELRSIWVSPSGALYRTTAENRIYKWADSDWDLIYENEYYFQDIYGTDDNNIFVYGYKHWEYSGAIFHFNGVDWYKYTEVEDLPQFSGAIWADDKTVFVAAPLMQLFPSIGTTLIYQGR